MPIIEFEGLAENLIPGVKELTDATVKLRSEVAATNDTIKKGAQESLAAEQKLGQTIEATAQSMADLNKNTNAGVDAVKRSREEAAKLIATSKTLTVAQREAAAAAGGVTKEYKAIVSASKGMEKGPIAAAVATKSLRSQLREAREELDRIVEASDGKITPELIEAGKRAGQLQDRFADLNATVESFKPDTQFRAALNILGNLSGGIQAASSAMGQAVADLGDAASWEAGAHTLHVWAAGTAFAVKVAVDDEEARNLARAIDVAKRRSC